jgi:DNA-binding HxlR family transcriptional regulator
MESEMPVLDPEGQPEVKYRPTERGHGLSAAFCSVWCWAEIHPDQVESARQAFDSRISA